MRLFLFGLSHLVINGSAFCVLPIRSRGVINAVRSSDPKGEWNDFLSTEEKEHSETPKVGIDLQLNALTPVQVAELKAELSGMVSDRVAAGPKDMEGSQPTRASTKLVSAADRVMEGKAIEVGVWGEIKGAAVLVSPSEEKMLLGSVAAAQAPSASSSSSSEDEKRSNQKRVLIVADPDQDPLAKALIPAFSDLMKKALPDLEIEVHKPTTTMPWGGENAACVILFATSLSDRSSVNIILERLLRKTIQGDGPIATPPTQIVAVSTLGTTRTNKLPYSMQNLIGGGKLDQRRQMEEAIISQVQSRAVDPPLDYTICKFGDISDSGKNAAFKLFPGDVLDGTTSLAVASQVLVQAVAFQPAARNATLCAVGSQPPSEQDRELWEDEFLRLDGPELLRIEQVATKNLDEAYGRLVEYIKGWAVMLSESGKGLTTPIQAFLPSLLSRPSRLVTERDRVQLLFLSTQTGKRYKSRDEEVESERNTDPTNKVVIPTRPGRMAQEGGLEVVVERTARNEIRLRVKRCNYADDAAIKELSEETILSRLRDAIAVWKRDEQQP